MRGCLSLYRWEMKRWIQEYSHTNTPWSININHVQLVIKIRKRFAKQSFNKLSPSCASKVTYEVTILLAMTISQMKWESTSICFVLNLNMLHSLIKHKIVGNFIVVWLPQCITIEWGWNHIHHTQCITMKWGETTPITHNASPWNGVRPHPSHIIKIRPRSFHMQYVP